MVLEQRQGRRRQGRHDVDPEGVLGRPVRFPDELDDGEQVDFQPSGSGWRTVLMCCDLVEPIVYVWTRDNDGNVLSTWTNAPPTNQVFLPVVVSE